LLVAGPATLVILCTFAIVGLRFVRRCVLPRLHITG